MDESVLTNLFRLVRLKHLVFVCYLLIPRNLQPLNQDISLHVYSVRTSNDFLEVGTHLQSCLVDCLDNGCLATVDLTRDIDSGPQLYVFVVPTIANGAIPQSLRHTSTNHVLGIITAVTYAT